MTLGQFFAYFHMVKAKFGSNVVFVAKQIFLDFGHFTATLAFEEKKQKNTYLDQFFVYSHVVIAKFVCSVIFKAKKFFLTFGHIFCHFLIKRKI